MRATSLLSPSREPSPPSGAFITTPTDEPSEWFDSITAILVARFMFDLQKAKHKSQHRRDFSDGTLAGTGFGRALGSIGSTLSTSDVWRLGPSSEPTSDHCDHAERSSGDLVLKFDSDVFGKCAVTSVILEREPALQDLETV